MSFECIHTKREFADLLDIPYKKLTHVLYVKRINCYYKTFEIPKKTGDKREICAPTGDLKQIQQKLYCLLFNHKQEIICKNEVKTNISHAFEKGKNIITNSEIHKNKRILANVDLKDFFDSFHFGRVCGFFEKNRNFKFSHEVSILIAQLTCYNGKLPQGAPTSPIITNLICEIFDFRILKLAKKYHLDYTRYADDLTFSTNDKHFIEKWDIFYVELVNEIKAAGFKVNQNKTRIQYRDSRQTVTGLTTNKKVNVDYRYYKQVRAMANSFYKSDHFDNNGIEGTLNQLEGKFSFIDQIDKYNNTKDTKDTKDTKHKHSVFNLNGREKQYQKFLYYKYFFANERPLIVTEGKTDIKYLKAALKKLYKDYPTLIEKTSDGHFNYRISFLNRTKRLKYFFGFGQDGADAIKNLYNFFSDKNPKFTNYYEKISNDFNKRPLNPVIFIFDNELSEKGKPLHTFSSYVELDKKKQQFLKDSLCIRMPDICNLYVATNPLVQKKQACEIEDLFDEATLNHQIENKTFSRDKKPDNKIHYGKEIFANYVLSNYQSINFDNFKPIFDNIAKVIDQYSNELNLLLTANK